HRRGRGSPDRMAGTRRRVGHDGDAVTVSATPLEGGRLSFAALRGPRQVLFGAGQRAAAGWSVAEHGRRALVCVDPHLLGSAGLDDVLASLDAAGVTAALHTDVVPEIPTESVAAAYDAGRATRADVL